MSDSTAVYWSRIVDAFRSVEPQRYGAQQFDKGVRTVYHQELLELGLIKYAGTAGNGYFLDHAGIALMRATL